VVPLVSGFSVSTRRIGSYIAACQKAATVSIRRVSGETTERLALALGQTPEMWWSIEIASHPTQKPLSVAEYVPRPSEEGRKVEKPAPLADRQDPPLVSQW
jgi:hypothetical protein